MLNEMRLPLIKIISSYLPQVLLWKAINHSLSGQNFFGLSYQDYRVFHSLRELIKKTKSNMFKKKVSNYLKFIGVDEIPKEDFENCLDLDIYKDFDKYYEYYDERQKEQIFRNFLIMLKPKYVYISYTYQCIQFEKFKNELSSSKIIVNSSKFEGSEFFSILSNFQSQIFFIKLNNKKYLDFHDMINLQYIKLRKKPTNFQILDLINFLPAGKVFVILSILTESPYNDIIDLNEGKFKLFISIKEQNKIEKDSAILNINKPIINLKNVFINSFFIRYSRNLHYGYLSNLKIPNVNIYGIYCYRDLSFLLQGDKEHKIKYYPTFNEFTGTKLSFSPNECFKTDEPEVQYFSSDSIEKLFIGKGLEYFDKSSSFPNIKKVKLKIYEKSAIPSLFFEKYSKQINNLTFDGIYPETGFEELNFLFPKVEKLTMLEYLFTMQQVNILNKCFDFKKLKYLRISFQSNKDFNAFLGYSFPNLETFITNCSITDEKSFLKVCRNFPKIKNLEVYIFIDDIEWGFLALSKAPFGKTLETICLSYKFRPFFSLLFRHYKHLLKIYLPPTQDSINIMKETITFLNTEKQIIFYRNGKESNSKNKNNRSCNIY